MQSVKFDIKLPIAGFESVHVGELTEFDGDSVALLYLEGKGEISLINPYKIRKDYSIDIPSNIKILMDIDQQSKVKVFCVFMQLANKENKEILVNFLAPFIFNCDNHTLAQIPLNQKDYPNFGIAEPIRNYIK